MASKGKRKSLSSSIRERKIAGPVDFTFRTGQWAAEAATFSDGSALDMLLLAIAPRFGETLALLRDHLKGVVNRSASASQRAHAIVAVTNRECVLASQKTRAAIVPNSKDAVSMDHLAVQRIALEGGAYSADEIAQTIVDMAELMLRMLAHYPEEAGTAGGMTFSEMAGDFRVGSAYAMVEHLWLDVLWNDFKVDDSTVPTTFAADDVAQQKARAVMWYRYHMLASQGYLMYFHAARQRGPRHGGETALTLRVDHFASPGTFSIGAASDHLVADQLARQLSSVPDYYDPYLAMSSPVDAQLSLGLVLRGYLLLAGVLRDEWERAERACDAESSDGSTEPPLDAYAPVLSRASLIAAFEQALGVSALAARSLAEFFAFDPGASEKGATRKDLWSAPCVALGGDRFVFVLHSFHHGNAAWVVDVWLRRLGFALDDRGTQFEAYVRARLKSAATRSPLKGASTVHPHALKFDGEEIDCVFLVGATLVLAEVKCFLLPVSPVDRHNHERKVRDAAEQIKRKHARVMQRLDSFRKRAEKCGLVLPDSFDVKAVVVLSNPIGAGQVIDGIPVLDLLIVERYFDGRLERMASVGTDGIRAAHVVKFWNSPDEAEAALPSYLLSPPQVAPLYDSLVERDLTVPLLGFPGDGVLAKHYDIDPDAFAAIVLKDADAVT